jgi:hypothetical protein
MTLFSLLSEDEYKMFYYRGLREFKKISGFFMDTCLLPQDKYKGVVGYFWGGR